MELFASKARELVWTPSFIIFKMGATAEQIVQSFPSLSLGDVYSSIAYYLTHRQEIEEYLQEQETAADVLQEQLESNPDYQAEIAGLRSRMLGRWTR